MTRRAPEQLKDGLRAPNGASLRWSTLYVWLDEGRPGSAGPCRHTGNRSAPAVEGLRETEALAAQRLANEVGVRLKGAGWTVRTWARQGDPHRELLAMVAAESPDLIVVGPRGARSLRRPQLGSLTTELAKNSPVPVLVAQRPISPDRPLPDHLVLVVDGSSKT